MGVCEDRTGERRGLVIRLRQRLDEVLLPLIPTGGPCALVGFPLHANVGDSAIWLAQQTMLARGGARVVYTCDRENYDRSQLAARLQAGTIFVHGGGSLGDVWRRGLQFMRRIVADFPDHRIVFFPQWIFFRDRGLLHAVRTDFNAHPDLVILARDRSSYELAHDALRVRVLLCPDVAFALGPLPRAEPPRTDVVWLARTDRESAWPHSAPAPGIVTFDWRREPPFPVARAARWALPWFNRRISPPGLRGVAQGRLYDLIANSRLSWGRRLLSRGRVVITDRFHGYILSLLQNIPHVLLDTRFGKLRAFYETWGEGCDLTRWANSPEEALVVAGSVLA
ncbi:MAG: polysaccharide pyruvyl transferase family protein [Armatimonadota bacterium]|nr:polysaccharide pyruvyl transferase family protein [Armatimonadota bacterium]